MSSVIGVAGITGKFSSLVVQNLLKSSDVSIRGYCRNSSKLPDFMKNASRLQVTEGDAYDTSKLRKFASGCDVVICGYLGDNELMEQGQKALVDACEAEGVKRYIASDYSFDYNPLKYGDHPAKDPMKAIKEYLEQKKQIKGVHVLIGAFMNTFWSSYFGVWDPKSVSFTYWGTGKEAWESTSYENAAKFVAAIAQDSTATGDQRYLGDRKTTLELAETFKEVYGKELNLKCMGTIDELSAHMHQKFNQDPSNVFGWMPFFYQYYTLSGQTYLGAVDNKYKIEPETFKDFMQARSMDELSKA